MTQMSKLPKFKSDEEESEYWDTHSAADIMDEGELVEIDASEARARHNARTSKQICLRLSQPVLERTRDRAKALGVPYQTLIQLWIAERLEADELRLQRASQP